MKFIVCSKTVLCAVLINFKRTIILEIAETYNNFKKTYAFTHSCPIVNLDELITLLI